MFYFDSYPGLKLYSPFHARGADDGVRQARINIYPNMYRNAKVPLLALLDLAHLGVALPIIVLGRDQGGNQDGIHHSAALEQQVTSAQLGMDDLKKLRALVVLVEQVTKAQGANPAQNTLGATNAHIVTVVAGLGQRSFGSLVGQASPLSQAVRVQHQCQIKRRRSRLRHRCVGHDLLHCIKKDLLAPAPLAEIKAKVLLLHIVWGLNSSASVSTIGEEF
jgi:hypothetical protein